MGTRTDAQGRFQLTGPFAFDCWKIMSARPTIRSRPA